MTHPRHRGMTGMTAIECSNKTPHEHQTLTVEVDLSKRHGYTDLAQLPEGLAPPPLRMEVWDWTVAAPFDDVTQKDGQWCPARDAVSETIVTFGIWEPSETLALLDVFSKMDDQHEDWIFLDIGAQLGWYSILARLSGARSIAVEADPDVRVILDRNLRNTPGKASPLVLSERITPATEAADIPHPTVVKIDIEGAEPDAVRMIWPAIESGNIKAAMIELSPVFGVDTTSIIRKLMNDNSYRALQMPEKNLPPLPFEGLDDLSWWPHQQWEDCARFVEAQEQCNLLFVAPDSGLVSE